MDNEALIYVGPSNSKLGLKRFAVYNNGLPEYISAMIETNSGLSSAFMPISEFAANNTINPGTPQYEALKDMLDAISKEAGK